MTVLSLQPDKDRAQKQITQHLKTNANGAEMENMNPQIMLNVIETFLLTEPVFGADHHADDLQVARDPSLV